MMSIINLDPEPIDDPAPQTKAQSELIQITKGPSEHILQTPPQPEPQTQTEHQTQSQTQPQTETQTQPKTLEVREDEENLEDPDWDEMCRIVDSSVLGYLGEDSVGNGEFDKGTGNSAREREGDNEEDSEYVESEVDSDDECSDFWDSEYMDSEDGEEVATTSTAIEPIPIPQPIPQRDSSSDSEGEESEDLVNNGDNFSSGKDSNSEDGEQDIVFNIRDKYDPPFELGMLFSTKFEFRDVVHNHAVKTRRSLKITKNDSRRVYARNDPKRNAGGFRQDVVQEIRCTVTKSQAYRAKRKALKIIEGKAEDQYDQLWDYAQELRRSNPMSTIVMADLGIERPDSFTFVSDKQKGLIPAFELVFLGAENRFCVRHLHENFKKAGFRGLAFKMALWNAAKATTVTDGILEAREKPIPTMLKWIREYLMTSLIENRDRAAKGWYGKQICPKIRKIIEKKMDRSSDCIPIKSDDWNYEVKMCDNGDRFTVNLRTHSCSCRRWDLTGIPCSHAMSAIGCQDIEPYDYVHESYSVSTYLSVYSHAIAPVNGLKLWEKTGYIPLMPPNFGRKRRRPARARRLGTDEPRDKGERGRRRKGPVRMKKQSFRVQCHCCENPGHNQMGCKRRKADIAAGLTRDFAALINANVGSGTEAGPFKKASTQKRRTNVENASNNDAGPSRKAPTQKRKTNVENASASCGAGASKRTKKRKCAAEKRQVQQNRMKQLTLDSTPLGEAASFGVADLSDELIILWLQTNTTPLRKSSKKGKGQKATAHVSASGSAHGLVYETLQSIPSAPMPKEGSQQPKLTARKRTFSEMANRSIAAPALSKFRPPSSVIDPAPKTTLVPQPRVNIRCPPPFALNHPNPILSQTLIVNSQGGVPVLMKGEKICHNDKFKCTCCCNK
ncbi:hypothetical protein BUALT_Bualt11G0024100 [Buddleja alternifolia]|uniref:SWIM-type domain-containing protein n=1 Tax=Buddleja alternifolia TaxID=168488 RepID=A0AAV6WQZ4_9LAMI|nr:hypothetical protein BUALT_Bualt11G0024100 [Buddleja alternifolia]